MARTRSPKAPAALDAPAPPRRFVYCPCCGALAHVRCFAPDRAVRLGVRVQGRSRGRGRGWDWRKVEALAPADRALLVTALRRALARLGEADAPGGPGGWRGPL